MGAELVKVKEFDGYREVTLQEREGAVFFDDGVACYKFDRGILLKAIERELGVVVCGVTNLKRLVGETNVRA